MILALILFAGMQGQGQTPDDYCNYISFGADDSKTHCPAAKPEPMVQPAIKYEIPAPAPCNLYTAGFSVCMTGPETRYKCADPERVLLTTESGRKLCVRFKESE